MRRFIPISFCMLLMVGCASHPTINPHLPEAGKVKKGYAFSTENVFPYLWYRQGISDKSEFGLRLGLPFYGTGIDYSCLLYTSPSPRDRG